MWLHQSGLAYRSRLYLQFSWLLRPLANRWLVICVNNHWPYLREFGRGEASCFDRPIEIGAAHLKDLVNANDADEVVIIGHSGGALLAQCMVARALELDPDLGLGGPRIVLLTIGSITPAVAFHPRALKIREIIRRLAMEPSIIWIECQSRKDALNFWGFDPVCRSWNSAWAGALQSLNMAVTISRHAVSQILPQTTMEDFSACTFSTSWPIICGHPTITSC